MKLEEAKEILRIYYYDLMGWARSLDFTPTNGEIVIAIKLCWSVWGSSNFHIKKAAEELINYFLADSPLALPDRQKM